MLDTHMASGILTFRPLHLSLKPSYCPSPGLTSDWPRSIYSDPPSSGPGRGGCDTTGQPRLGEAKQQSSASGRDTDPAHSSVMSAGAGREGVGCFSGELEPSKTKHSAVPAGAMELLSCVLLWKLVLLQSECESVVLGVGQ